MEKTIREWIKLMPVGVRENLIQTIIETEKWDIEKILNTTYSLGEAKDIVSGFFSWNVSRSGLTYWGEVDSLWGTYWINGVQKEFEQYSKDSLDVILREIESEIGL